MCGWAASLSLAQILTVTLTLILTLTLTLSGVPPLTGVVGGAELLLDEGIELFEAVKAAGVDAEWREYEHGFHAFVIFPFGQAAAAWAYARERLQQSLTVGSSSGQCKQP